MEWLKNRSCIFIILLIFCFIIYVFPWIHKIDTTIQGIQFRISDEDYSEDVSIKVKGVYNQYLIKNDTFEGIISIDSYDFTLDVPITPTKFYDGHADLIYDNMHSLGWLICTPDFDKLMITVYEPKEVISKGWSGENGLIISAPAKNRVQALEIAKILFNKSKWLSRTKWD